LQVPHDPLAVDRDEYLASVKVGIELGVGVLGHREERAQFAACGFADFNIFTPATSLLMASEGIAATPALFLNMRHWGVVSLGCEVARLLRDFPCRRAARRWQYR